MTSFLSKSVILTGGKSGRNLIIKVPNLRDGKCEKRFTTSKEEYEIGRAVVPPVQSGEEIKQGEGKGIEGERGDYRRVRGKKG
jgi:hypothetical protein